MKRIVSILLVLLLLLTAGCGTGRSTEQTDPTTWITYEESSGQVTGDSGDKIFTYSYQQPVVTTGSGATVINTRLDNTTTAFLYGSGGVQELTEMAKMDSKESWFTCYALNRTVTVARADQNVVSFRYVDYAFTGGVHGYTTEYGITYDLTTGEQLNLAGLTDNEQALKAFCREYILELTKSDAYGEDVFLPNYEKALDTVLNHWVLTGEGLQFIAQPYVIAAYSAGTLRFTIPYSQLGMYLNSRWLPEERGHGGGSLDIVSGTGDASFVIDSQGDTVVLRVNGTVYDFSVEGLGSYYSGGEYIYYMSGQHLYSPEVSSISIALQLPKLGSRPNTMVRCCSGNGSEYQFLISPTESGGAELIKLETNLVRE